MKNRVFSAVMDLVSMSQKQTALYPASRHHALRPGTTPIQLVQECAATDKWVFTTNQPRSLLASRHHAFAKTVDAIATVNTSAEDVFLATKGS